jgi:hypothetical protein
MGDGLRRHVGPAARGSCRIGKTSEVEVDYPTRSERARAGRILATIDRARIQLALDDEEVARRREAVLEQIDAFELIFLDPAVLERAAEPFPTVVGTLAPCISRARS